jgi:hypothetical protein
MKKYFYSKDKKNWSNPINLFELVSLCIRREIARDTYIWHKDLCPVKTESPERCRHLDKSIKASELKFLKSISLEILINKLQRKNEYEIPGTKAIVRGSKNKNEFQFVLTLINYRGMGTKKLTTNLHEWFEAIEFYKSNYYSNTGKNKTRIGTLIYSTFFENSDFYNIIGSLCRIKLGFKGSSYLFWKTRKYERLLGIGRKTRFSS